MDSERFRGHGVAPKRIAEATLDAVLTDQFYVFYGEGAAPYLESVLVPIVAANNPPVIMWGRDLRPAPGSDMSVTSSVDPTEL